MAFPDVVSGGMLGEMPAPVYAEQNASVSLAPEITVAVTKTEVISVRVPRDIKSALAAAAGAERRSLASMVEVMVLDYCRAHGIDPTANIASAASPHAGR